MQLLGHEKDRNGVRDQHTFVRRLSLLPSSSKSSPSMRTRPSMRLPDGLNASSVSSGVSADTP